MINNGQFLSVLVAGAAVVAVAGIWLYYKKRKDAIKRCKLDDYTEPVATVDGLWIYPLKSAHQMELEYTECTFRGLKNDRCWVVVDNERTFLNQKKCPKLATVVLRVEEDSNGRCTLVMSAHGMNALEVGQPDTSTAVTPIKIFSMIGEGQDAGNEAARWISEYLGVEGCRIYFMSNASKPRMLKDHHKFADISLPNEQTSFSNFSTVFVVSQSSLNELNTRLETPLPMNRFRPNIVVTGSPPHAETGSFINKRIIGLKLKLDKHVF